MGIPRPANLRPKFSPTHTISLLASHFLPTPEDPWSGAELRECPGPSLALQNDFAGKFLGLNFDPTLSLCHHAKTNDMGVGQATFPPISLPYSSHSLTPQPSCSFLPTPTSQLTLYPCQKPPPYPTLPTYRLCSIASSSIPVRLGLPFSPRHRFRSQTDLALDPALPLTTCVFGQVTLLCTPPLPRLSHGNKDPLCIGICEDVSHLPPNSY